MILGQKGSVLSLGKTKLFQSEVVLEVDRATGPIYLLNANLASETTYI